MIPRLVKLGTKRLKVLVVKHLMRASDRFGGAWLEEGEMYIDPDYEPSETFIHELTHHVTFYLGYEIDEGMTVRVEKAIALLIRDNPGVFRWLIDEIAGPDRATSRQKRTKKAHKRKR